MFLNQESLKIQEGFQSIETLTYQGESQGGAHFTTMAGHLFVTFYAPGVIRLQVNPQEKPGYDLLTSDPVNDLPVNFSTTDQGYLIQSGVTSFELTDSPLRFTIRQADKILLQSVTDRAFLGSLRWMPFARSRDSWLVSMALKSGERVYGLGEKFGPLNRRGQLVTSWNEDATTVNAELSYKNIPFAWSPAGWGVFTHTTSRVVHAVGYPQWSHRSYIMKFEDLSLDLFFVIGDTPGEILEKYTALTGRAQEVPRWSYGTWMSRAYYRTEDEILEVASNLRQREIPCDVLVLDGRAWHKMETRFDFQWDSDRYPNPAGFIKQLRQAEFKLCLWEYPYISVKNPLFTELAQKNYLLQNREGGPYIHRWLPYPFDSVYPHLQPSGMIDFTNPEAYQWYIEAHKPLFDIGASVMKTDYGESIPEDVVAHNGDSGKQLHNVYSLLYNRCVYEASVKYSPDGGMVWGRAGWSGSQRYPIQWGGDPQSDWEGLAASIRGGLSFGMSGGAYYSHDIGGFGTGNPPPELYIRWAQAGIMMSHTRFHGAGLREPWYYGAEVEGIVKKWLNWRYRLIPYLQSCALQACQNGLPLMRAMPLAYPADPRAWSFEEQYMLGPCLLVVPVLSPENRVQFYLPQGAWFDLWTGERIEGGQIIDREVPLDHIPIFGRSGTVLPLGPAVQHTGQLKPGIDLDELWVFGQPDTMPPLPGMEWKIENGSLINFPEKINLKLWE